MVVVRRDDGCLTGKGQAGFNGIIVMLFRKFVCNVILVRKPQIQQVGIKGPLKTLCVDSPFGTVKRVELEVLVADPHVAQQPLHVFAVKQVTEQHLVPRQGFPAKIISS